MVDALMAEGVGVRDHTADDTPTGPALAVELDPIDARRTPVMAWEPRSGWWVAVAEDREVYAPSIRYMGIDAVPAPPFVASVVLHWRDAPLHLLDTAPFFPAMPRADLDRVLADRARWGQR